MDWCPTKYKTSIYLTHSKFSICHFLDLISPSGFGPSNGLNFVVNFFEPYDAQRSSKNFILSITNENNPFDIFKENYVLEPGNIYTYRVVASQIGATERFNEMDAKSRNCSLPHEKGSLVNKLLQFFDKLKNYFSKKSKKCLGNYFFMFLLTPRSRQDYNCTSCPSMGYGWQQYNLN